MLLLFLTEAKERLFKGNGSVGLSAILKFGILDIQFLNLLY